MDYIDKLSDKEKKWLNKFMDEYNGANLDFKNLRKNLHKNKKLKKDCTDRVNARNRDTYAKAKITSSLYFLGTKEIAQESENPEDAMISYLDNKYATDDENNGTNEG